MITNFSILIMTHLVSDWFFQPDKWAKLKKTKIKYLILHSIQYTALFIPVFYVLEISMLWLIWLLGTHLLIDNYKFVTAWNKYIRRAKQTPQDWFLVAQDQILHVLAIIPIIL